MAGFATHAIYGEELLKEGTDRMPVSMIKRHQGVFGAGCQGPDLFLYNIPMLLSCREKNLGIRMHHEKSSRYFANLVQVVWEAEDAWTMEIGISYLYGALAHYTLDSMIHPYVYARIGYDPSSAYAKKATAGMHHRLESAIDAKMIAVKKGILPSGFAASAYQIMTKKEEKTLAAILEKAVSRCYRIHLKKENVLAAFQMMKIITNGFFVASDGQREYLQRIEFPFQEDYGLTNFMVTDKLIRKRKVMNTQNEIWHNPWNWNKTSSDSVWEIYDKAVEKYDQYCTIIKEVIPLYPDRFFAIMGEESEGKEFRHRIYHAAMELGNLSYETGLPLSICGSDW